MSQTTNLPASVQSALPGLLPTPSVHYLNVHKFAHPWEHPAVEEVLAALQRKFPHDPAMVVEPLRGVARGGYKVTTSSTVEDNASLAVSISGKQHLIPLVKASQVYGGSSSSRREGTLVTFLSSTQGCMAKIPNDTFDKVMAEHGEVVKPTEWQKHRGTAVLNGNRYLVLVPRGTIPAGIQVADPNHPQKLLDVTIRYKGQQYYCTRCMSTHTGACPSKAAFYAAKDARAKLVIKTQIISDSTLRSADATGLTADVICMSGGRIGEIAHIVQDAPKMESATTVIMLAGSNDIMHDSETVEQFQQLATTAVTNIVQACTTTGKTLSILAPLTPKGGWGGEKRMKKDVVYHDLLQALSADKDHPFTYLQSHLQVDMEDIHPTGDGVAQILADIDVHHKGLIWNKDFITCDKIYKGVHSVYRYGCLMCSRYREVEDGYCPHCTPPSDSTPTDDDSMSNYKRDRDSDTDLEQNKKPNNGSD